MNDKQNQLEDLSKCHAKTIKELRLEKDKLAALLEQSHDERHVL